MPREVPPLGVLVKRFPKLSETFILEEVLALERIGITLRIYALAPPSDAVVHPAVARVRAPVVTLPVLSWRSAAEYIGRHARALLAGPLGYLRTLGSALVRGPAALRAFASAGWLAEQCRRDGVSHLHCHFISAPADIALLSSRLLATPFSISAHAKDIYLAPTADLRRKLLAAAFTVTCTEANRHLLAAAAPAARVQRMYHGVDHALFHPARRVLASPEPPLIVSVGRLVPKKGLHHLVQACARLRERGIAFRCEIVGYGGERGRLAALIEGLGLQAHVLLVGKLARDAVIERYAGAACYVQPSCIAADGDRDGIPNVLLEAMAIGAPVVATRVSGIPELVTDGCDGLLVEPEDPTALATAIERLLKVPALGGELACRARQTVVRRFDNDRNVLLLVALLQAAGAAATTRDAAEPAVATE